MTIARNYDGGAGCIGKVAFATWAAAQRVLKRHARTRRERRDIYRCPACRCFHLGRDTFGGRR